MPRANPSVESALGTLKRAASGGKTAQPVLDTLEALSSSLALLNSSSPSHSSLQSLIALLRAPFVPLYVNYLDQSLYLTLAICKKVMNSNILPALTDSSSITDKQPIAENRHEWEQVLHSLFSGILDFLDNYNTETAKTTIARILYPPLCEYFFPRQSKPVAIEAMGVTIRRTAYSLLSDTLAFCPENQTKLNDSRTLGPKRLGMTITRTTDFACLENLLTILAQLLPSARSKKRTSFLQDVFLNRNRLSRDCSNEIIRVLEWSSGSNWEAASVEIIDILARHDSSFPQPFSTKKLVVCGQLCEQPAIGDRVYMDRYGFFINIRVDDDLYESLQAPYRTVKNVTFSPSLFKNAVQISILLSEVPRMGDQQMKLNSQTRCKPSIIADIDKSKVGYFIKIANKRSLSHILNHQDIGKLQTRVSLSVMSTPLGNLNSPHVEAKLQEMESFYRTISSSGKGGLKTPQDTHINDVDNSPCVSNEALENTNNQISLGAGLITNVHPPIVFAAENLKDARRIVKPSASLLLRQSVFGKEDEEISEIESFDSPTRFSAKTRRDQGEKDLDDTVPTPRCDVSNKPVECNEPMKSTSAAFKNASKCQSRVVMSDDEFSNREVPDLQAEDKAKTRKTHTVDSTTGTAVNTAHRTEHSILTDNSSGSDNILLSTKNSAATTADKTSILKDTLPVLTSDSGSSFPGILASDHDNRSHPYMNTVAITELGRAELDGFSTSEDVTMIDDSSKSLDTSAGVDNLSELPDSGSKKRKHHMIYKEENKNTDPQGTKKGSVEKTRSSLFGQIYSTTANARRSQRLGSKVSPQAIRTPERGLSGVSTGAAIGVGPNKSQIAGRRQPNPPAPTLSPAKDIPRQNLPVIDLTEEKNVEMVNLSQSPSMEKSSVMEQGSSAKNALYVSKAALATRFPENCILPAQHRVAFDPIVQYRQASVQIASSANNDLVPSQKRKSPVQTQPTHNRQTKEGQSLNYEPQMDDFVRVLDDIQRAIVDNFTRKSTAVRADIRIARDTMLRDATDDLGKMREKSVKDLKSLICLESKYVHLAHNLSVSYEAMSSVNGEISDQIQQVIHAHDRTSLSRAMPTSLFSTDLPPVFCSSD